MNSSAGGIENPGAYQILLVNAILLHPPVQLSDKGSVKKENENTLRCLILDCSMVFSYSVVLRRTTVSLVVIVLRRMPLFQLSITTGTVTYAVSLPCRPGQNSSNYVAQLKTLSPFPGLSPLLYPDTTAEKINNSKVFKHAGLRFPIR